MTRGTLFLITDNLIIESIEFNGDMYPEGHGQHIISGLEKIENVADFKSFVEKFNKENHNYTTDEVVFPRERDFYGSKTIVMSDEEYFRKFGSDWTFWKNISDKSVTIKTRENKNIVLKPSEQVAISFGHFDEHYKSSVECAELIKKQDEEYKIEEEKRLSTIEKQSLYFRNGASDKVYHIQTVKEGSGYVVRFQYGRRGSNLKEGVKTNTPVSMEVALGVMNEIVREKIKKGYRPS